MLASKPRPDYLGKIQQLENQLNQIQSEKNEKINELTREKEVLQNDLVNLSEQNAILQHEKSQIQQDLATAAETIKQLKQSLVNEQEKRTIAENNLAQEKTLLFTQRQSNQSLQETNTNLKQKIHTCEQNYSKLQNTYQITLKDKQAAEMLIHSEKQNAFIQKQKADCYETQLKSIAKTFQQ